MAYTSPTTTPTTIINEPVDARMDSHWSIWIHTLNSHKQYRIGADALWLEPGANGNIRDLMERFSAPNGLTDISGDDLLAFIKSNAKAVFPQVDESEIADIQAVGEWLW